MWDCTSINKKFIPENEEIRWWFKVTSNRKKVWNVQLWILEELKKICKKYDIKYYADWGTLLWAIRHKWYIPRDDDMDIAMFRSDYEKFFKIAEKELPKYIKLWEYYWWFSKLININTAALWYENWWDEDFVGGIRIDIFPIDYASKFMVVNRIKSVILRFLWMILISQKSDKLIDNAPKRKRFLLKISKIIFRKIDCSKIYNIHKKISKKVFFKWNKIYTWYSSCRFFPGNVYDKSHSTNFENTTICIPDWYDKYLRPLYGDYMKPVIWKWWHHCRYSVDKSYKDIIKTFDRSKSNEDNYNNCKSLFAL